MLLCCQVILSFVIFAVLDLPRHFVRAWGKPPYRIVMKFCIRVGVPDHITYAKFTGHRVRVLGTAGVEFPTFPLIFIDFRCRP